MRIAGECTGKPEYPYIGGNKKMKVYDSVKKTEVEVNGTKGLIDIMRDGRQVDLYLKEKKSDADG